MIHQSIEIVRPGDLNYDEVSPGWNILYHHEHPLEIMLPKTVHDVGACLLDATQRKVPFRIRSGGHDVNGYSSAGGCAIIDLRHLDSIAIDEQAGTVTVGPTVRFQKLYPALAEHDLVVPAGICLDVAVGGHALGGGNGYLHRFLGASCDQVIGLKMIDPRGALVSASAEENPDLFWALRGAGNANFGIVVEYTYRTTKVGKFSTFALTWDWEDYDDIFNRWQAWAPYADTRLTSTVTLYKDEFAAMGMFAGPRQELLSLLPDWIRKTTKGRDLTIDEYPRYDTAMGGLMGHYVQGDNSISHEHSTFSAAATMHQTLDAKAVAEYKHAVRNSPGTSSIVLFARGGRICGVPTEFNAYRYRTQSIESMFRTTWKDDKTQQPCLDWITGTYDQLKSNYEGVYKNWTYSSINAGMYEWYGELIPELVRIKRKYDPQNIFHNPQSLPVYVSQEHIKDWHLPETVVQALRAQGSLA